MANPNAVVSIVVALDPPLVELQGGRRARLDPANRLSTGFAQILDALHKQRRPVYLEIDPASAAITRLLIPRVTRVMGVRPIDEGALAVQLEFSHARHTLRRNQPDFAELEWQVRDAMQSGVLVIVTEDDAHNILHIRLFQPGPDGPTPPFPEPEPRPRWPIPWLKKLFKLVEPWRFWPWNWFKCLTLAQAQQVFDALNATSCDPLTVPPPCTPFLYPDNGCWARAHEMCRLMINMGHSPRKVWIFGFLVVKTANSPSCKVFWDWHVAPTLCVRGAKLFQSLDMVFDPALFTTPVSKFQWKAKQGDDPGATLASTDASVFWYWGSVPDPTYSGTNYELAYYRLELQNRALQYGPPPYVCT